jgi:dipeptidyl aminopeptidase/acylaminoacyl peptidase
MLLLATVSLLVQAVQAPAPGVEGGYKLPPPEVVEILDAPPTPGVEISPDARWMLLVERPSMPSIEEVARPWVGLAGVRIDPGNNGRHQVSFNRGLVLRDLAGKNERRIELPEGARVASVSWSHSSRSFAFTLVSDHSIDLWAGDIASGKARRLASGLNTVLGGFDWLSDGSRLIVRLVPAGRGSAPEAVRVPSGPVVQETSGKETPVRTFPDLLASPHDERLFEHYAAAQLAIVDPDAPAGESVKRIGEPGLILGAEPSPDGLHLLVETLCRPFSYVLPLQRFPRRVEVWDLSGAHEALVAELPLGEAIPIEGVPTGPRDFRWKASDPATLVWVEALDGGDPRRAAEWRDRWMALDAPFEGEPRQLLRTEHRARGLTWFADPAKVLASEYDRDRRWTRTLLVDLADPAAAPVVLEDRSVRDRYADQGRLVSEVTTQGARVLRQDGDWVYRAGEGDSEAGARPFLDRQNLRTLETERLWRCAPGCYERVAAIAISGADRKPSFVSIYESPDEPPNWRLRDLQDGSVLSLTSFTDPTPQLRGIQKQLVTYPRADGVQLSATLYLPKGYEPGARLPLVVWAYPLEYSDPATAGQVSGSPYRFIRFSGPSHLLFLTQGYAVLDGASMPVVGDPETMNDTFIEQIVASAKAAIDHAAALGVADPERAAVGGHSYGAFMTANLLAHCDLFRAGIARSGAYNRTLTPFGFQSERRTLWEAPQVYARLSPFFHADTIDEPLLMIHGAMDSNPGTYPMQSERLYQAIQGHGGTARLVQLPAENHGYAARESVLHAMAEMIDWLDRHVKGAPPVEAGFSAGAR